MPKIGKTELRYCIIYHVNSYLIMLFDLYLFAYFGVESRFSCFTAGLFLGVSTQSLSSLSLPPLDNDCTFVVAVIAVAAAGMFDDGAGRLRDGGRGVVAAGEL